MHHHDHHWNHHHHGGNWNENYQDDDEPLWLFITLRIIYTLWLGAYIIPNIFLIVTFMKPQFYKHNFFYTMVHWSFANLCHMVFAIYLLYVPDDYKDETLSLAFLAVHCIISGISLTMAVYLVFDKFINSKNFCVKMIRQNWVISMLHIAVVLTLVCTKLINIISVVSGYVVFSSLALLIFFVRLLHFLCKGSEEPNYRLRAWISGIFILSSYLFTTSIIVEVLLGIHSQGLLAAALIIVLANGFINTALLYKYQKSFNSRVAQIAQNYRTRFNKNDTPTVAQQNDFPPKYDDPYEAPPNYEEAAKGTATHINMYQNAAAPAQQSGAVYEPPIYEEIDQYGRYSGGNQVNGDRGASTA